MVCSVHANQGNGLLAWSAAVSAWYKGAGIWERKVLKQKTQYGIAAAYSSLDYGRYNVPSTLLHAHPSPNSEMTAVEAVGLWPAFLQCFAFFMSFCFQKQVDWMQIEYVHGRGGLQLNSFKKHTGKGLGMSSIATLVCS